MPQSEPRIFFTTREQVFRVTGTGLMPLTVHYFYFERRKVAAAKLKMVGGKTGDMLITDENGRISFDYYYDSGVTAAATTEEEAERITNLIAGPKNVVLSNIDATSLPTNFKQSSTSYMEARIHVSVFVPPASQYTQIQGS